MSESSKKQEHTEQPSSSAPEQKPQRNIDEELYNKIKEIYDNVKKAIENNKAPKEELQAATNFINDVITDDKIFEAKPKAAKLFYGDFISGAGKRLLLEGPIDDFEYLQIIKHLFYKIIELLRKEIDADNSDLIDSTRALFETSRRLYKFQFMTPEQNQIYQKQLMEKRRQEQIWRNSLQVGDMIDAVKIDKKVGDVKCWGRAIIESIKNQYFSLTFVDMPSKYDRFILKTSDQIGPLNSKSEDYQWKNELNQEDNVDVVDPIGTWYNSTILSLTTHNEPAAGSTPEKNYPIAYIGYRVFNEDGKKVDDDGRRFAGWSKKYDESIPLYSPRIAKFNSKTKYLGRGQSIYQIQKVDDSQDNKNLTDSKGNMLYVMPREYFTTSSLFTGMFNKLGQSGGFNRILERMEDLDEKTTLSFETVFYYTEMISRLTPMFHRQFGIKFLNQFGQAVITNLLNAEGNKLRSIQGQRFDDLVPLLQKILTRFQKASNETYLTIDLFSLNMSLKMLKSDFFNRRIQGFKNLNQITKQLRFYFSRSFKADYLAKWLKDNQILKEVFGQERYHLQLIQRSSDVIKFLLLESEITSMELNLIWNAVNFDQDTRMEVLKLIKQISMQLSAPLCNEITDKIIQSSSDISSSSGVVAGKIMDQLLDALFQMARFAMQKYDYTVKITLHLKKIAEDPNISTERADVAIQRYSQLLKVWPMSPDRQHVLVKCVDDIAEHRQPLSAFKIIRNIIMNLLVKGKSEHDKYERAECVQVLVDNFDLMGKFFQDFEYYCSSVQQHIRDNLSLYLAKDKDNKTISAPQSPNDIKLFDRYPHSEQIKQRLDFLHFILSAWPQYQVTKQQVEKLWEILVSKSLIISNKQSMYKWLKKSCTTQNKQIQIIDIKDMISFFSETMCSSENNYQNLSVEGFECIKQYFLVVNQKYQKIQRFTQPQTHSQNHGVQTSTGGYSALSSDGIKNYQTYSWHRRHGVTSSLVDDEEDSAGLEFKVRVPPAEMKGSEVFWNILLNATSKDVVNKVTDFIIKLYQQVDSTLQERSSEILQLLVLEALSTIQKYSMKNEEASQNIIARLLNLLKILLLQAQKSAGNGGVKPHSAILKGQLLKLTINNSVFYKKNIPRKLEFNLYSNTTIWQLRNLIARINGISPEMIRLIKAPAREVKDSENAKTLLDMRIQNGEIVIASKRSVQNLPKANLVTASNQLTPAAKEIFLEWFVNYQDKPELLTPVGLANFTKNCTQDPCMPSDKRIQAVFEQYDKDGDGGLNQKQFLQFYRDSSVERPKVVWNNILNHGYRRDLKKRDFVEKQLGNQVLLLPRYSISSNSKQFNIIFNLLNYPKEKVAKQAWALINQLITSPQLYQKILHLSKMNESMKWEDLLDANSSIYKLLYSLQIIESFLQENKGKSAEKTFFIEEQKKKNKEGKEEKVEIKNLITFEQDGSVIFHQKKEVSQAKEQGAQLGLQQQKKDQAKAPSPQQIKQENQQKLLQDWRLQFVQKGGISYLLKLFFESGQGKNVLKIKDDMDRNQKKCLGFVLRILKLYIISAYCSKDDSAYNLVFERQSSSNVPQTEPKKSQQKSNESTTPSRPSQFIGPLSRSHYNVASDTYSITESLLFDDNDLAEASGSGFGVSSQYEASKKKSMTSKQGRELVGQIRGYIADEMLQSINFKQLQKILLDAVVLILTKKTIQIDDTKTIQNALNLWLVCMLNQPELIQEFYDFRGVHVKRQQVDGVEKVSQLELDCCGMIRCGLFCHKSMSIRQQFQSTLLYIASKIDVKEKQTKLLPLSVIIKKLLQLLPRQYKQQTKQCKEYFSLLCQLLDLCFQTQSKEGGKKQGAIAFNPEDLAYLAIQSLIKHKSNEKRNSIFQDKALIGYINLTNKLLSHIDSSKISQINSKYHLSQQLFTNFLFAQYKQLPEEVQLTADSAINLEEMTPNKCKTKQSRAAAYNLLSTIVRNDVHSLNSLVHDCLLGLTEKIKVRNSWAYTPASASRSIHGYSGLRNLGCICYMLAMLQQFYMVPSFRYQLMRVNDGLPQDVVQYKKHQIDDNILHQLQKMLAFMELTEREDYNPFDFCFACKDIEGNPTQLGVQQDAQEFLNVFFDRIQNCLRPTPHKYLLFSVFGGKNCNQCICQNCGNITRRVEDFYNLSLEVRHCKTVYDSLEKYVAGEKIDDYFCEACQQKATVVKRTCLSQLPNVLIVHLQRITLDYDTFQNVKINTRLQFPTKLDLKPYMQSALLQRDEHEKQEKAAEEQADAQEDGEKDKEGENAKDDDDDDIEKGPKLEAQKSSTTPNVQKPQAEQQQQQNQKQQQDESAQYQFKLVGVVIQIGTADAGHYYSYINTKRGSKNDQNSPEYMNTEKQKWLEFNDSHVRDFKFSTLDAQCFGGQSKTQNNESAATDLFSHWAMRGFGAGRENCKNAYMLVYEKHRKQTIKLIVENQQAQQNLKEKQTDSMINTSKTSTTQAQSQTLDRADPTVTREQNQDQQSPPAAPPPPVAQSIELAPGYISTKYDEQKKEHYKELPFNSITKYVPHHLYKAVWEDNNQFLFEKQIYANEYFSFLRDVLIAVRDQIKKPDTPQSIRQTLSQDMVAIGSKMVLQVLSRAYSNDPITKISQVLLEIYQQNESSARKFLSQLLLDEGIMFTKLMFGCPDKGVRECVAKLTSTCLNLIFKTELDVLYEQVQLFDESQQESGEESQKRQKRSLGTFPKALSVRFLDFMQGLVRGDCHKNWTRFDQFFSIYRQFVMGGQEQLQFMFKRELISALIDFMLGNSSPLKVPGQKRSLMGSRYMIPCFDPIVETVSYMALHSYTDSFYKRKITGTDNKNEPIYKEQQQLAHNEKVFKGDYNNAHELTLNELICLRSPALVEKSLKQNHGPQSISKFIAHFSYNNYEYSLLIAKIILNGVNQADYQQIVPYLESISEFLLISDSFRFHRLEWLLGISLPSTGKLNIQISRFGLSMLDSGVDQVTNYYSPLMYDNTNDSILTLLWRYHKKWDTYAMRCLNTLLSLMLESQDIFDWIFNAAPPIIQYSRYSDWFVQFNKNYIQDLKRYQSAYSTKREEIAENSKKMLEEINQKIANRVQQNRKNYAGQQVKPLRMTYTEQTDDQEEKKIEQEIRFIENFPPNYVISDTIEQKIVRKISNCGIDVRIYEIYTNVYYSRPNGLSSTVVSEEYFRVKKQRKEFESKYKIAGNRQPIEIRNEEAHSVDNVVKTVDSAKQPVQDQKIDQDISPLGQISDDQAQDVTAKELKKGTSDTDSGENIMKLTKVKEESVEPNVSVVQPQTQPIDIKDSSDNTAEVELNEYNYIHDNPFVTSSVLKFTVHNTTDKPLQSSLRIFPVEGKTANFYIPICDLNTKIKPNSLRVAAFFQKKDINEVWGDYQVQLEAHQIETGNRSLSKAIGPVDQLKYTNQSNLNIGVSGDLDGMDQNYDIDNQANYFLNEDDHLNNTDSDSQYVSYESQYLMCLNSQSIDDGRIERGHQRQTKA